MSDPTVDAPTRRRVHLNAKEVALVAGSAGATIAILLAVSALHPNTPAPQATAPAVIVPTVPGATPVVTPSGPATTPTPTSPAEVIDPKGVAAARTNPTAAAAASTAAGKAVVEYLTFTSEEPAASRAARLAAVFTSTAAITDELHAATADHQTLHTQGTLRYIDPATVTDSSVTFLVGATFDAAGWSTGDTHIWTRSQALDLSVTVVRTMDGVWRANSLDPA